jgi:UDP-N-acetylmuramyl tripeptide synthase
VGAAELVLLLIKNPAGANEVLRILPERPTPLLFALNDRIADGRDVSWIWDVDWEVVAPALTHVVCSGTRAADAALRLKYAGADPAAIEVVPDPSTALDRVAELAGDGTGYVLPTYTAMLELQRVAAARGLARPYWEEAAA